MLTFERAFLSDLHSSDLLYPLQLVIFVWHFYHHLMMLFLSLMFGRSVRLCILVSLWCLINHFDFLIQPCETETHSSRSWTSSNQKLYLPLSIVSINLCRFNWNRIMQSQCLIMLSLASSLKEFYFPIFWTKWTLTFPKIHISSFSRIHRIGLSWFNDFLIISYLAFQLLNLECVICIYVKPGFG
jgi:hypothetical protein